MPKLGEFIGALLSDVSQARVRADLEALKIAESYTSHDLLRHLPVPRFRLPDITVDFPVMVSGIEGGADAGQKKLFEQPLSNDMSKLVRRSLLESGVKLSYPERRKVYAAVQRKSKQLFQKGPQMLLNSHKVSLELSAAASNAVGNVLKARGEKGEQLPRLEGILKGGVKSLLLDKLAESPRLQVNVTSGEIKGHGDNESLLRVRLVISEDAYEVVSRDGEDSGFVLTPE